MSVVFADTFYFLSLMNRTDRTHARCIQFSQEHRETIVTTAWVLVEVADAWSAPPQRIRAGGLLQELPRNPRFRIIPPTQSLLERGIEFYIDRRDKKWSLTDCISFVVMENEGIREALTGDHDFEQAGFVALLK